MTEKKKYLLVVGCSHAAGAEIDGNQDSAYNRKHSYGNLLAKKLNRIPVNIAIGAMSNGAISRMVLNWVDKFYDSDTMDLFVLVSWTEATRIDLPVPYHIDYKFAAPSVDYYTDVNERFLQINAGWVGYTSYEQSIVPYWHHYQATQEPKCFFETMIHVLHTQHYLKSKGVEYMMCNTMKTLPNEDGSIDFDMYVAYEGEENEKHLYKCNDKNGAMFYIDLLDKTRYKDPFDVNKSFYRYYKNLGYANSKAKYWHHGKDAHADYAKLLYKFYKENY